MASAQAVVRSTTICRDVRLKRGRRSAMTFQVRPSADERLCRNAFGKEQKRMPLARILRRSATPVASLRKLAEATTSPLDRDVHCLPAAGVVATGSIPRNQHRIAYGARR